MAGLCLSASPQAVTINIGDGNEIDIVRRVLELRLRDAVLLAQVREQVADPEAGAPRIVGMGVHGRARELPGLASRGLLALAC